MKIEQIYTGCLAQGAYYIESNGEAAIIDPLREIAPYMERAAKDNASIKYIFETHFHADFVSGHVTLADRTGATIVYGPTAATSFDAHIAQDNEVFTIGDITITALHTPGHTMESTTYLLKDAAGKDHAIFTGDTLFLGDVGRPDLAQKAATMTQEDLAGLLFDSLRQKIMPLADDVTVYPAHGAGSACGKNMMSETVDTLGNQKSMNYALRADMTKEEFVKELTDGLMPPPSYFPLNVKLNKTGYSDFDEVLQSGLQALSVETFEEAYNETDAIILDVRDKHAFAKEHIPGSVFIGLDGSFAPWVGSLVSDTKQAILLIVPEGREEEAVTRLARVGFDNTLGYLENGLTAWKAAGRETTKIDGIKPDALAKLKAAGEVTIVDARKPGEYNANHVCSAISLPLDFINSNMSKYPSDTFYMHCKSGYRSLIAASILKRRGIHHVVDVLEGFDGLANTDITIAEQACESMS